MFSLFYIFATLVISGGLVDSQVLQRDANGTASAVLQGSTDSAGRLSFQVDGGAWTDGDTIRAGQWQAKLPPLRTGGPYQIRIRATGAGNVTIGEKTIRDVYVGDLWVLAGQSNMVGRTRIDPAHRKDPNVRMYSVEGAWQIAEHPLHEPARKGSGLGIEFGIAMVRATKVPIGLIPCAKGGTSMAQWSPTLLHQGPASLYGNLVTRVRAVGGRVAGILWYQGENDTGTKPSAIYKETFRQFVPQLRADLGAPNLPFYYAQLARYVGRVASPSVYYGEWNVVQEAQRMLESEIPQVHMIATVDLEMNDLIHLSRESLERVGRRFARAVQGKAGPRIESTRWESRQELRVRFTGVDGVLTAPGGRVFGFETTVAGGPGPLYFQASIDAKNHEVVLRFNRDSNERQPPAPIDLWYGRGLDPICNLTDSSDLALPMSGPIRLPPRPPLEVTKK